MNKKLPAVARGTSVSCHNLPRESQGGPFAQVVARAVMATLLTAMASTAEGQDVARSLDPLQALVKPGDVVSVADGSGQEVRGTIVSLSPTSLELAVAGAKRNFSASDIGTIRQRRRDSLRNGAFWGLGFGAGLGIYPCMLLAGLDESGETDAVPVCAVLFGGIGAGIGAGLDALVRRSLVIFRGPAASRARLTVSPIVRRDRKGVLLSYRFREDLPSR